jgi:hypothetical protein
MMRRRRTRRRNRFLNNRNKVDSMKKIVSNKMYKVQRHNDYDGGRDDNRVYPVFKFGGKEMKDASGVTGRLDTSSSVATNT